MMPSFIEGQKVDASAAFTRLMIVKKAQKEIKRAINDTNTVDIAGEHKALYDQLESTLRMIGLQEEMLIHQGE